MALIELNKDPSPRDLKWFGLLLGLFLAIIGLVVYYKGGTSAAQILWAAGGGLALLYYAMPPLRKPMFVGWMMVAFPIGWTISHLILAITYYLVMTPIGLVMRAGGWDPLARRFLPAAETYWIERKNTTDPSRYFKQF